MYTCGIATQSVPQITADEVYKTIQNNSGVVLLDVRTPGEFAKGAIEGSVNIPVDELFSRVTTEFPDKNKTIYLYCLSGSRSDYAAALLMQNGYTAVFSMTSGLLMWRSKKYPLSV